MGFSSTKYIVEKEHQKGKIIWEKKPLVLSHNYTIYPIEYVSGFILFCSGYIVKAYIY